MCGIAALLSAGSLGTHASLILAMTDKVAHRGPDGAGVLYLVGRDDAWQALGDENRQKAQVALGHRRLSILDLSEAGKQPMCYRGRLWITYNGEIYNYVELRTELTGLGHVFHSHSDTEVILAAYDEWGAGCFTRMRGMWGLVLIDTRRQVAILSRDRLGIKPLYTVQLPEMIAVVSEIKQLLDLPGFTQHCDRQSLSQYILTGYEDCEHSFFEGVTPLAAGTYQECNLSTLGLSEPAPYWFPERIEPVLEDPIEASREFGSLLEQSVRLHLRSDVPVGCALSGGLDSSSIAVWVQRIKAGESEPLHTFTAAFPGHPLDEQRYVDLVVRHISATAHRVVPTAEGFLEDLDRFVWIHDEPVGSLSQYAGYCVARLTRSAGVPVTLNGQGGDEVFAGYWQSYFMYLRSLLRGGHWLNVSRHFCGALAGRGNPELVRQVPTMLRRYGSRRRATQRDENGTARKKWSQLMQLGNQARRVYEIRELFLPRLLKWDDRNFMAFSVEGRYPFLDHVLIEFALSLAPAGLYERGWTKEPLRRALAQMLPHEIVRRRSKIGFETPQEDWSCGVLRPTLDAFVSGDSPVWPLVDRTQVRDLATSVWQQRGRYSEPVQELLRIFLVDRWMRRFQVQVA